MPIAAASGPATESAKGPYGSPYGSNQFPTEVIIGALVPPVLLGLLASRLVADAVIQAGLISEQFYRGERLPTLNVSVSETESK